MILTKRQERVYEFARRAHGDQKRKYSNEPYISHPLAVAGLVHRFCPHANLAIEISLLHDVPEDTEETSSSIFRFLRANGYSKDEANYIRLGVEALTDIFTKEARPNLSRRQRKQLESMRLCSILPEFQTIKYADLIHNTESIVENDPSFAVVYISEKRELLNAMRNGNLDLFVECYKSLLKAEETLKYESKV